MKHARLTLLGLAAIALALAGCGENSALPNVPAEQDYPLCGFRDYVDAMQEPAPHDAAALLRWANAMQSYIVHLRLDQIPAKTKVPAQLPVDASVIRRDASAYVSQVRAAGTSATKLDAAFSTIASAEFSKAVRDVYAWDTSNCTSGGSS